MVDVCVEGVFVIIFAFVQTNKFTRDSGCGNIGKRTGDGCARQIERVAKVHACPKSQIDGVLWNRDVSMVLPYLATYKSASHIRSVG
jgi:hypothetical protein